MKFIAGIVSLIMGAMPVLAQNFEPTVTWKVRQGDTADGLTEIIFEGSIKHGWHTYGVSHKATPTVVEYTVTDGCTMEGPMYELLPTSDYHGDNVFFDTIKLGQKVRLTESAGKLEGVITSSSCEEENCGMPEDWEFSLKLRAPATAAATEDAGHSSTIGDPVTEESQKAGGSIWGLILEAILWGFAMLLTPCVFPMVPMTISFFMKGSSTPAAGRFKAFMYGLFIVLLYTVPISAIIGITYLFGGATVTADIFNWLATHWLPNIIFFIVFMVFAASFFGAFEITMPSWMVNKTDSKADSKGLAGIFFMALTLVLVSFSCTGPIVGSVLIKSTAGEFWSPIVTMLAFSVAFALPFTLFAFFPSMLKKLPKSGGWLNSVKVVLGFIEVALGMKFLSVADQTYHWGLLDREIYLAVWIVTFSLLGLYLLGKIKFAHDSDMPYLGVGRLALAIVTFSLVVYLVPGMWGAPLKGLSGYLPPLHTQDFVIGQQDGSGPAPAGGEARMLLTVDGQKPKHSDFLHLPHNLEGFFDLKEAEAYAAKVGKPLFIDFTGHGCVNCREMEARVWSDPQVLDILRNDYVIVALYSDDKKVLPESEWVTTDAGKVLKSLGKINSYYALKTFGVNAQPYYVLQGRGGKELVPPRGYDLDVQGFVDFLRSGVEAYDRQK